MHWYKGTTPKAMDGGEDDLYVFGNSRLPGIYKCGRSKDVEKRRKELQQSQPFHIITHAVFAKAGGVEYRVHQALAEFRVDGAGREWFQVSLERILTEIGKCLDKNLLGEALEQFEHVEPA